MTGGFPVFRLFSTPAEQLVLVRFRMPTFSNTDVANEAEAQRGADRITAALLQQHGLAPDECTFVGTQESTAVGDDLFADAEEAVELFWAATRYGAQWLVLGTAPDEATFWHEVDNDEDLADLAPFGLLRSGRAIIIGTLVTSAPGCS